MLKKKVKKNTKLLVLPIIINNKFAEKKKKINEENINSDMHSFYPKSICAI